MVVGQPAEETLSGRAGDARRRSLRPVRRRRTSCSPSTWHRCPPGMVAHGSGPILAGSLTLRVVRARPRRARRDAAPTVDPVVAAAAIVLRLQTIVVAGRPRRPSRSSSPWAGSAPAPRATWWPTTPSSRSRSGRCPTTTSGAGRGRRTPDRGGRGGGLRLRPRHRRSWRSRDRRPGRAGPGRCARRRGGPPRALRCARVADWPASMATEDVSWFADAGAEGRRRFPLVYWMLGSAGPREWAAACPGGTAEREAGRAPAQPLVAVRPVAGARPDGSRHGRGSSRRLPADAG